MLPLHVVTLLMWAARIGKPAWAGIWQALKGMGAIWKSRLSLQRARRAPWWQIASALSWSPADYFRRAP
jgi:hypothetical protein